MAHRRIPLPLPSELIGECLSHCDPRTLSTAALASRSFQGEADPYLWQDVRLDRAGATERTLYAVSRCPQRVQYVRSLSVDDPAADGDVVSALLELLPALQSLELVNCGAGGTVSTDAGGGMPFPFKLRRLRIVKDADRMHARDFELFLASQPDLRVLELPETQAGSRRMEALAARAFADPGFLPRLETLVAPPQVLSASLYGRRILQHLVSSIPFSQSQLPSLRGGYGQDVQLVCSAIRANAPSCNVVTLSISATHGYETLTMLATVCPNLQTLELGMSFGVVTQFCRDMFEHRHQKRGPLLLRLTKFAIHLAMDDGSGLARPSDVETIKKLERHLKLCFPRLVEYTAQAHGHKGARARRSGN